MGNTEQEKEMQIGKRFVFGIISILCVSGVSAYLKYDGEIFLKLVGAISGLFLASQTATDIKK